jgi:hypothetical protein
MPMSEKSWEADIEPRRLNVADVPLADVERLAALLVSSIATFQRASCRLLLRIASTTSQIESITSWGCLICT